MQEILNNRLIKTEMVEWKKLVPFQPDNLKKTEPHKLQKLANSLCQNGFSMNFYVWEKDGQILIIDGHSRHEVLQLLESGAIYPKNPDGKEYSVTIPEKLPCSFLHLKNKTEAKKAVLIYNSKYKNIDSDIMAEWVSDLNLDELKSQIEIPELKLDFDMPQELENDSIDDAAKIKTDIKLGDLIEIGRHRLLCGDSTKKEDVERLMDGKKADMVFTDPPYNMQVDGGSNQPVGKSAQKLGEAIKHLCDFDPIKFLEMLPLVFDKNIMNAYIFCNKDLVVDYLKWGVDSGYSFNILFWKKPNAIPLGGSHRPDVEYLLLFRKSAIWNNGLNGVSYSKCLEYERSDEAGHPTIKPIKLVENEIQISSNKNSILFEPFTGSGTTMVACQTLDRTCYGMELEPLYIQVIINRMRKNFPELEIKVNGKEYKEI